MTKETAELIYHSLVICIAVVVFFLKISASNAVFEFILKAFGKLAPLFVIIYAGVQIFKLLGLV